MPTKLIFKFKTALHMDYRASSMALGGVYFYTATIHHWEHLLQDSFKFIIINSLLFLKRKNLIEVYGYVIMPNHIHLLWQLIEMNGKEKPNASLLKFTAHEFKKQITHSNFSLEDFRVKAENKDFEFWQRDALAIPIYTRSVAEQKLNYMHKNPVQKGWELCRAAEEYPFSSATFYYQDYDPYGLVSHYLDVF